MAAASRKSMTPCAVVARWITGREKKVRITAASTTCGGLLRKNLVRVFMEKNGVTLKRNEGLV